MREGVMRLAELAERFAGEVKTELVLIEFDDSPRVLCDGGSEDIKKICAELMPKGGTNIGAALGQALTIASTRISLGNAVQIALFTDGEDPTFKLPAAQMLLPRLCIHCIGICREADARVLNTIAKAARRGTFQQSEDISALMGALWGLMMEVVDDNITIR